MPAAQECPESVVSVLNNSSSTFAVNEKEAHVLPNKSQC